MTNPAALEPYRFSFYVDDFQLFNAVLHVGQYLFEHLVHMSGTVAHAADSDCGELPKLVIPNLGDRDVESLPETR